MDFKAELTPIDDMPPQDETWGMYDFHKSSFAVVAVNYRSDGVVLWSVGGHLRLAMEEHGLHSLEDLGLYPPLPGIWVWEGMYCYLEDDSWPEGVWRAPLDTEWKSIIAGRCPWDDSKWKLQEG